MGDRLGKEHQWNQWSTVLQASHHSEGSERAERFSLFPHCLRLFEKMLELLFLHNAVVKHK